jgi:cell pole-organizing protein PopZ
MIKSDDELILNGQKLSFQTNDDVSAARSMPPPVEVTPWPTPAPKPDDTPDKLLTNETKAAINSAFNKLAYTVLVENGRTLEDMVCEMLRPMLKSWLNDNLPSIVERLVRAEIERVSRGRPDASIARTWKSSEPK